jgi:hypothetical protein
MSYGGIITFEKFPTFSLLYVIPLKGNIFAIAWSYYNMDVNSTSTLALLLFIGEGKLNYGLVSPLLHSRRGARGEVVKLALWTGKTMC